MATSALKINRPLGSLHGLLPSGTSTAVASPRMKEVKPKEPPADIAGAIRKHLKGKKGHKDRVSRLAGLLHTTEANIELAISNRGSGLEIRDGYVVEGK